MAKILAIALKDLLRSFRSLFAIGMMFVAPMLITGLIYLAFGNLSNGGEQAAEMQTLRVGIINLDEPQSADLDMSRLVVDFLQDPALPEWIQAEEAAPGDGEVSVDLETYGVVVVIPNNFSNAVVMHGSKASLDIYYDPALTIQPQVIKALLTSYVDGLSGTSIALEVATQMYQEREVRVDTASLQKVVSEMVNWTTDLQKSLQSSDPAVSHLKIIAPTPDAGGGQNKAPAPAGNILALVMSGQVIFFAFYTGAYSCMSILTEHEEGTLARLFTTPTPRTSILAGKFVAVFLTVIVQVVVLLTIAGLAFGLSWGPIEGLALVVPGLVVAAAGLGIFLIALVKTERQAGAVLGGVLTFAGMLGGLFTVAVQNMPTAFESISLALPQGWALRAFRAQLGGAAAAGDLLLPFLVMLVFGAGLFALGAVIFRKRFA